MPTQAQTLGAQLLEKQIALRDFFKAHESKQADRPYAMTPEEIDRARTMTAECNDLGKQWEESRELEGMAAKNQELGEELAKPRRDPRTGRPSRDEAKAARTFGEVVCGAIYGKDGDAIKGREVEVKDFNEIEFKTTMTTSAGFAPEARRSGKLDLSLQTPLGFVDILPTIPVPMGTYTYMRETTFTNAAAAIAEAGTYPESALAYSPVTATITKIGTFIPVTEEQLSDVDGMQALIDNRLRLMVRQELEDEVLTSTGTSNEINGFLNVVTQSQALGTDPIFDAVLKGMTKVRTVGFAEPDAIVFHPNDWQDVRLTRTEDGVYIMGNPDQVGLDRLFGVRTVIAQRLTEGTALLGDFGTHSALLTRWGLDVKISDSDGTDFIKDILKLKARVRAGLAIFRVTAFCKVTGI